jgi:dethiobiotin synthetase
MIVFVSGIDTDVGKTVATARLLEWLLGQGKRASAMKLVQTGLRDDLGDRAVYQGINKIAELPECPACFSYPASPDLAASLEGKNLDLAVLEQAVSKAGQDVDTLLVEGAGGLLVPLTRDMTTLDWVQAKQWPVVLVASARLGAVNHSLLSLEVLAGRGISLQGVVFNEHPVVDVCMRNHALESLRQGLARYGFSERIALLPSDQKGRGANFAPLFGGTELLPD